MKQQKFVKSILTKRLELKPLEPSFEFATMLFNEISNNREYFRFMPFVQVKSAEEEFKWMISAKSEFESGKSAVYAVWLRKTNEFVGLVDVHSISWKRENGEFGAWILKKFARQGYTTEALKALEKYFFDMGFHKLTALANVKNRASCGTIKKLGFTKEGVLRDESFNKYMNEWENYALFSKLATEYTRGK